MTRRVLITGGVRSGKSRHAERLLSGLDRVDYVAPGPTGAGDAEWAARIALHQARRPDHWVTIETADLAAALSGPDPMLIDCLGTWVTAVVDGLDTWDQPLRDWQDAFDARLDAVVDAWRAREALTVAVTNEVGWGLVSEHRSGRVFTDLLGRTNQAIAAVSDDVVLVVAGRALTL